MNNTVSTGWRTLVETIYGVGAGCSPNIAPITTAVCFEPGQQMRVPNPKTRPSGLFKGGDLDGVVVVEVPGKGLLDSPDSVRYFYDTASALRFEEEGA